MGIWRIRRENVMAYLSKCICVIAAGLFFYSCSNTSSNESSTVNAQLNQDSVSKASSSLTAEQISKEILLGKFEPSKTPNFVAVPEDMCSKPMYVQKETLEAFINLKKEAETAGINLQIVSGTRNFYDQKAIWERKWESYKVSISDSLAIANEILKFSSMPGTSRHHWGTDIDLNSVETVYFESAEGTKLYNWLKENAGKHGFCQVYSDKAADGRSGYSMEKWHWSYLPLANTYLQAYNSKITYSDINGFVGDRYPEKIGVIQNYVNGLSKSCN
ncbi:MAG: M15 family metallopeptidase [Bacteroidota bacterium]